MSEWQICGNRAKIVLLIICKPAKPYMNNEWNATEEHVCELNNA